MVLRIRPEEASVTLTGAVVAPAPAALETVGCKRRSAGLG